MVPSSVSAQSRVCFVFLPTFTHKSFHTHRFDFCYVALGPLLGHVIRVVMVVLSMTIV